LKNTDLFSLISLFLVFILFDVIFPSFIHSVPPSHSYLVHRFVLGTTLVQCNSKRLAILTLLLKKRKSSLKTGSNRLFEHPASYTCAFSKRRWLAPSAQYPSWPYLPRGPLLFPPPSRSALAQRRARGSRGRAVGGGSLRRVRSPWWVAVRSRPGTPARGGGRFATVKGESKQVSRRRG
jgi:hypothetical protein